MRAEEERLEKEEEERRKKNPQTVYDDRQAE